MAKGKAGTESVRRSHLATWTLALLPGLMALAFLSGRDFSSPDATLNTLGRLTGIWGMALILVAAMLCCRVPGFDRPFGGLTKLWQLHHRLGAWGFLLILAHPVLLSLAAAGVSLDAALATLFSWRAEIVWGWVALLALMVFMAPTFDFFGQPEYQRWKWLHRLSGVMLVFALIHTFMLSRTLPGIWSYLVWGTFTALTLTAIGYRWLYSRWRGRLRYRVSGVAHPANNVVELSLEPLGQHLEYQAGQFVYLTPWDEHLASGRGEEHPYTLSSAPGEPILRTAIKDLGDASRAIQSIAPGSEVSIEGPYGRFFPDAFDAPELWIAGGIGITPFLGRLRHAVRQGEPLRAHLVYCVQDESRALFRDELQSLIQKLPQSRFSLHLFYQRGPLDLDFIRSACPDFGARSAYLCGPMPLIELARGLLVRGGVAPARIVTEEFVLL